MIIREYIYTRKREVALCNFIVVFRLHYMMFLFTMCDNYKGNKNPLCVEKNLTSWRIPDKNALLWICWIRIVYFPLSYGKRCV